MSGVYIPGMAMPKDGFITITVTSDGRVVGNSKKESGKFEYLDNEDIAKAVSVPDHGRLIDADALMENAKYKGTHDIVNAWDIMSAPTIIPAEEGEP